MQDNSFLLSDEPRFGHGIVIDAVHVPACSNVVSMLVRTGVHASRDEGWMAPIMFFVY